jgi:hypothetical protein
MEDQIMKKIIIRQALALAELAEAKTIIDIPDGIYEVYSYTSHEWNLFSGDMEKTGIFQIVDGEWFITYNINGKNEKTYSIVKLRDLANEQEILDNDIRRDFRNHNHNENNK